MLAIPSILERERIVLDSERESIMIDLERRNNIHRPERQNTILDLERQNTILDLEQRIRTNNFTASNRWESCCFVIDRRVFMFISQLIIGFIIIAFCIYKLISDNDNPALYYGLLTFIIGVFLPAPKVNMS